MNQYLKIYFAPFQGITTPTFRRIFAEHFVGIDKMFTPYFSGMMPEKKLTTKNLVALKNQVENGIEIVPQILSNDADEIIVFANNCQKFGFNELNWNLGCPHPQVADKKRGSGLLPYPERIDEILQKVSTEIKIKFSIKCRLGYFSSTELEALIPIFNRYQISELTIHARTGRQMYSGQADQEAFSNYASQLTSTVVYNGDIFNLTDYRTFSASQPDIQRLMMGRGILSDPFLPARIKGFDLPSNPKAKLRKFMEDLYIAYRRDYNDQLTLLNSLKEYWIYLANSFEEPHKVFRKVKKVKSFDDYEEVVSDVFNAYDLV